MKNGSGYLSQKVREARGEQTLRQFAQKCGLSPAYIQKIERGISRGKPCSITVLTLARLVNSGVEIDYNQLMTASLSEHT